MKIPLYQVNAFTSRQFSGNPAAVCPLERWLPNSILQAIAAENNLSETAYFIPREDHYELRWFTPTVEVDLCGHATLATAYVIWAIRGASVARLHFDSKGGPLAVERTGERYVLDFPSRPPNECKIDPALMAALGANPHRFWLLAIMSASSRAKPRYATSSPTWPGLQRPIVLRSSQLLPDTTATSSRAFSHPRKESRKTL